jgi:CrcB protein
MDTRKAVAVAFGGVLGAGVRWVALQDWNGLGVDLTILLVNVAGTAILAAVVSGRRGSIPANAEALLGAGFCGAFTTWSTLALLTAEHLRSGDHLVGLGWLLSNIACGVAAAAVVRTANL